MLLLHESRGHFKRIFVTECSEVCLVQEGSKCIVIVNTYNQPLKGVNEVSGIHEMNINHAYTEKWLQVGKSEAINMHKVGEADLILLFSLLFFLVLLLFHPGQHG